MKTLIAYFSTEMGRTKALAEKMQEAVPADLFEIVPTVPYTDEDVNYFNPKSRCNVERFTGKDVPVSALPENFADYELVLIGFPIWYGSAPIVVNTFCKALDFSGKKVAAFATSGGDGIGATAAKLAPFIQGAELLDAKLFRRTDGAEEVRRWVSSL